ncbi:hypothetical protein MKEN_00120700 [Mycena kentingensis (nom. inval.)]|nr:hypothetical protein MKEN_00120700 [Mycena kentingensis (nom. inval.)]
MSKPPSRATKVRIRSPRGQRWADILRAPSLRGVASLLPNTTRIDRLVFTDLVEIEHYWSFLSPIQFAIAKHRFSVEYSSATVHKDIEPIFWRGFGRSSQGCLARPSSPDWHILTHVNGEGSLKLVCNLDSDPYSTTWWYSGSPDLAHVTPEILPCLFANYADAEFVKPYLLSILLMGAGGGSIRCELGATPLTLGEVVVQPGTKDVWGADVFLRTDVETTHLGGGGSLKWTWHDDETDGIWYGIPGWTRFTINHKTRWYSRAACLTIGDRSDPTILRTCLDGFVPPSDAATSAIGFVNSVEFRTHINGRFKPTSSVATTAPTTIYLFLENIRIDTPSPTVGTQIDLGPYIRYFSFDPRGTTRLTPWEEVMCGVHEDGWYSDIEKSVHGHVQIQIYKNYAVFKPEAFRALEQLRALEAQPTAQTRTARQKPILRRSQSLLRTATIDWHKEWFWEEYHRSEYLIRRRMGMWRVKRKRIVFGGKEDETDDSEEEKDRPATWFRGLQFKMSSTEGELMLNTRDGEIVYHRALLLSGSCKDLGTDEFVSVHVTDAFGRASESTQTWPAVAGRWKALVLLSPGENTIQLKLHQNTVASAPFCVVYQPLLQLPPLHLAILVAKDSPLVIDCPPSKFGAISNAHSSLDAAIAKFRLTAYMWQAQTAEDLRLKGLGRRSFRLDEERGRDTTVRLASVPAVVPKVHIVRTDKTVAELREEGAPLQDIFLGALRAYGAPFDAADRPVVAGLILDTHYSPTNDQLGGQASAPSGSAFNPDGISLGMFGSHLTYSWPRFLEEIAGCLLDTTPTGDVVASGGDGTGGSACAFGQATFFQRVGGAFGLDLSGFASYTPELWARNFIAHEEVVSNAVWEPRDALKLRACEHFRIPGDPYTLLGGEGERGAPVEITSVSLDDTEPTLVIWCPAGLAKITFTYLDKSTVAYQADILASNGITAEPIPDTSCLKGSMFSAPVSALDSHFGSTRNLSVTALGLNGVESVCPDVGDFFSAIPLPGSSHCLHKTSIVADPTNPRNRKLWRWATLLHRPHADGSGALVRGNAIDLRVGAIMDGAAVHYEDGTVVKCGPPSLRRNGPPHVFGGHLSQQLVLQPDEHVVEVSLNARPNGWGGFTGVRMALNSGRKWGELNGRATDRLRAPEGERIVGFYGKSQMCSGDPCEFGIFTVQDGVELPTETYAIPELQNLGWGAGGGVWVNEAAEDDGLGDDSESELEEDEQSELALEVVELEKDLDLLVE